MTEPDDWRVDRSEEGVRLSGQLRLGDAARVVSAVRAVTGDADTVEIDLGNVEEIDGGVAALLGADLIERGLHPRPAGESDFARSSTFAPKGLRRSHECLAWSGSPRTSDGARSTSTSG